MADKNKQLNEQRPKERARVLNLDFSGKEGLLPIIFKTAGHFGYELGHAVRMGFPVKTGKTPETSDSSQEPEEKTQTSGQLLMLRQLCSPEKLRMIQTIRHEKPVSVYDLARKLGRNFKAVRQDLEILRHFGIISLAKETDKGSKRQRLRPILALTKLQLNLQF